MARSQARIHTSVWRNRDFIKLTASAQATYWMVLSQPDVNMAGVVAYMPERWAQFRNDGNINADLAELEHTGFLIVDPDSREVWIRSFVRNDGVLAGVKTRAAMWSAWQGIFSETIRGRFITELDRLSDTPSHTPSDRASDTPSDTPSDYVQEAIDKGWISPEDAADARREYPIAWGIQAPQDGVSDGVSPRARADSASSSDSTSTSPPAHTRDDDPFAELEPPQPPKSRGEGSEDPLQHPVVTDLPAKLQRAIANDTPQARGRLAKAITRANGHGTTKLKQTWDDPTALDHDSIKSIAQTLAHRIDDLAKEA